LRSRCKKKKKEDFSAEHAESAEKEKEETKEAFDGDYMD
jgi:hypothetical protein